MLEYFPDLHSIFDFSRPLLVDTAENLIGAPIAMATAACLLMLKRGNTVCRCAPEVFEPPPFEKVISIRRLRILNEIH